MAKKADNYGRGIPTDAAKVQKEAVEAVQFIERFWGALRPNLVNSICRRLGCVGEVPLDKELNALAGQMRQLYEIDAILKQKIQEWQERQTKK